VTSINRSVIQLLNTRAIYHPYKDNHQIDRFRPIFYIIQHIPSKRYYLGYKSNKMAFFQEGGYCTSCDEIHDIILKEGFSSFQIIRIRYFETGEEALKYETRLLHRVNAASNAMFFNQHNGDGNFVRKYYSKESGKKISESLRALPPERKAEISHRIAEALRGKSYLTEEGRQKISQAAKGNQHAKGNHFKHTDEVKALMSQSKLGKQHSIETKKKISFNRKGKGIGENNSMSNLENRAKLAAACIGRKKLKHPTLPAKLAKPGTAKWDELIALGYK
jgi:NUMOD3 motif